MSNSPEELPLLQLNREDENIHKSEQSSLKHLQTVGLGKQIRLRNSIIQKNLKKTLELGMLPTESRLPNFQKNQIILSAIVVRSQLCLQICGFQVYVSYQLKMSYSEEELDTLINAIFAKYDIDDNKTLDKQQISQLLNDSYKRIGKKEASASQISDIIKKYDKNKDGVINKGQLKEMMKEIMGVKK